MRKEVNYTFTYKLKGDRVDYQATQLPLEPRKIPGRSEGIVSATLEVKFQLSKPVKFNRFLDPQTQEDIKAYFKSKYGFHPKTINYNFDRSEQSRVKGHPNDICRIQFKHVLPSLEQKDPAVLEDHTKNAKLLASLMDKDDVLRHIMEVVDTKIQEISALSANEYALYIEKGKAVARSVEIIHADKKASEWRTRAEELSYSGGGEGDFMGL